MLESDLHSDLAIYFFFFFLLKEESYKKFITESRIQSECYFTNAMKYLISN